MPTRNRRIGFGLAWAVMFITVFSVQAGHQYQLMQRGMWMKSVNSQLESHDKKLDILSQSIEQLPESMTKRFLEIYQQ